MSEITSPEQPLIQSALAYELETAEKELSLDDRAYLVTMTLHDLYDGHSKAIQEDDRKNVSTHSYFQPPIDGRDYLQAGVPAMGKDLYSVGELPNGPKPSIEMYEPGNRKIVRVPQCHMLQMPKDKHPYFYLTLSTCSACIGYTDKEILVAHVGLSERGGMEAFIHKMQERGVQPENMYAVASVGTIDPHLKGARIPEFDFSRIETVDEIEAMGIPRTHIQPFTYLSESDETPNNLAGVVVTPEYIASYQCDFSQAQGITGGIRDFIFMETA